MEKQIERIRPIKQWHVKGEMTVSSCGVSGNGEYIVYVVGPLGGNIGYIWNGRKGKIHRELIGHTHMVMVWNIVYLIQ